MARTAKRGGSSTPSGKKPAALVVPRNRPASVVMPKGKPAKGAAKTPPAGKPKPAWMANLDRTQNEAIRSTSKNVNLILTFDSRWQGVLAYNEFAARVITTSSPPWMPELMPAGGAKPGPWSDQDTMRLAVWLQSNYGIDLATSVLHGVVHMKAHNKISHPVRDKLNSLKWDKKPRLDEWLIRLGGAEDTKYVREVSKNFMIAAVARVMKPGAKVDTMLILEGPQGLGKSTMMKLLAWEQWHLESMIATGTKDGYQILQGKWIVEMAELSTLQRGDWEHIKQYLTQTLDTYRPSYGRENVDLPRQCVFVGTTNAANYLKDDTGNRRFQPVKLTKKIDFKQVEAERDQLWAEAVVRYKAGEKWYLDDPKLLAEAAEIAEVRRTRDPAEQKVADWLAGLNEVSQYDGVTVQQALSTLSSGVGVDWMRVNRGDEMRATNLLHLCGWSYVRRIRQANGVRVRRYCKYDPATAPPHIKPLLTKDASSHPHRNKPGLDEKPAAKKTAPTTKPVAPVMSLTDRLKNNKKPSPKNGTSGATEFEPTNEG